MTAMDVQMRAWRSSLEMWRRMFDLQVEVGQHMLRVTSAWSFAPYARAAETETAGLLTVAEETANETRALTLETAEEIASEAKAAAVPTGVKAPEADGQAKKAAAPEATTDVQASAVKSAEDAPAAAKPAASTPAATGANQTEKPAAAARKRN